MSSLSQKINRLNIKIGEFISFSNLLLVFVIILQVVLRYGFGEGMVALEELQWHLYAVIIMLGMSYASAHDSHVRVDILSSKFSLRTKAWIEIFGYSILLIPFLFILVDHGLDFVQDSFKTMESSVSPGGLPYRWVIKSLIPISGILMMLSSVSRVLKNVSILMESQNGHS